MNDKKRRSAEVFPVGEYIKDELEARGWNTVEFAEKTQITVWYVQRLIDEKEDIKPWMAKRIGDAFGTGAEVWLNLDQAYKEWIANE